MQAEQTVLALDIGGTKLAAALVASDGRVIGRARVRTPSAASAFATADAEDLWAALAGVIAQLAPDPTQVRGVGVGCSGPMAWPDGLVSPLNIPGWRDFPLRERLRGVFRDVPVHIHNDAVCFAIGEHWQGAGRDLSNLVGMVVSTGVGGGLILGDRVVDGSTGNAGHIGHVVVDPDGPSCACGGIGCLEAIASGPRLAAWAGEQGWTNAEGISAKELAADAGRGHPIAVRAMERAGTALGVAIASVTSLCDLDAVVIGGGLSNAWSLLAAPLHDAMSRHAAMAFTQKVRVVPASLGSDAGLLGAAALVVVADRYWSPAAESTA